jgi:hypothetical protein
MLGIVMAVLRCPSSYHVPCVLWTKRYEEGRQLRLDCASRFIRRYFVSMVVSRCIASEFTHLGCRQYVFAGLIQRYLVPFPSVQYLQPGTLIHEERLNPPPSFRPSSPVLKVGSPSAYYYSSFAWTLNIPSSITSSPSSFFFPSFRVPSCFALGWSPGRAPFVSHRYKVNPSTPRRPTEATN